MERYDDRVSKASASSVMENRTVGALSILFKGNWPELCESCFDAGCWRAVSSSGT